MVPCRLPARSAPNGVRSDRSLAASSGRTAALARGHEPKRVRLTDAGLEVR
jgi:hypothetical protein